jgi:uncharacterized membrane protein
MDSRMDTTAPTSTAWIARRPISLKLVSVPAVCFTGALATDVAYALTSDIMWADFSAWLLAAGLAVAVLAVLWGVIDLITSRRARLFRPSLLQFVGEAVVLVLAFFDNLVHSRDAWTSVVPLGLTLSAAVVAAMLLTELLGRPARVRNIQLAGAQR